MRAKPLAFITGIAGQDGSYLAALLVSKGYRVVGLSNDVSPEWLGGLKYLGVLDQVKVLAGSLTDELLVESLIKKYQPDEFYNLAGISSVAQSWENPLENFKLNAFAVVNLLETIRRFSPHTKFFQASSAEIFGQPKNNLITESTSEFKPLSPYGAAKLIAHQAVINARTWHGLYAVNGIMFNHESPLRPPRFVTKIITRGVADIVAGKIKHIELGNLSSVRDFGYAGDFVVAMWKMLQAKTPQDYVICTGVSYSIEQFVRAALNYVGLNDFKKYVRVKASLKRKNEVKSMRGSPKKIKRDLKWKIGTDFKALVKLLMDFELSQK